jgi:hypothetical protein
VSAPGRGGRVLVRLAMAAAAAAVCSVCLPAPVAAQDAVGASGAEAEPTRLAVSVDYVSAEGLYLAAGADQGVVRGDTVAVFADADGLQPWGYLAFTSVTRRRSVAQAIGGARALIAGDVVFVPLVAPAGGFDEPTRTASPDGLRAGQVAPLRQDARGVRLSGRLAFDLDARETRTAWSGDLFGETHRRFATPTTRLSLSATHLPSGISLRANVRASYRYDELHAGPPPLSLRAYELAAVRDFDLAQVMVGRFANPYESYSAYWDGLLLRVGRARGLGVGIVAGFEPTLHNEGPSSALPKLTGFADFSGRGGGWRYDTDLSVHLLRPTKPDGWSYAGWSQRLTLGRVRLSQRLRVDGGLDGRTVSLGDLRLRASVDVAGPLRLRGGYGRSRAARCAWGAFMLGPAGTLDGPVREEAGIGLDLLGRGAWASFDGSRTRREGAGAGLSVSGTGGLQLGRLQLLASGRRWARGEAESLGFSPGLAADVGPAHWRLGYRFYRTSGAYGAVESHAGEAQVGFVVARGIQMNLRGEQQWGANLTGTRVRLSLWRSF